jgi:phage tail sheath gpL-like
MPLTQTSIAAAVGAGVKNVQFQPTADNVPHKILIIGTYDPLKTAVTDEAEIQILSPEDAGDQFGFGFMIHRLAVRAFESSGGVETWVVPQAEIGGAVEAEGTITFTASGVLAGTAHLYIAGLPVPFVVADGDDETAAAVAAAAAVNAIKELHVTALSALGVVTLTAKTKGPWGDDISIKFNIAQGDVLPTGLTAVVVDMASGAGLPDIADALNATGTGDDANERFNTEMVHGYGTDTTTLDIISTYVGAGNDFVGLYDKLVARPFRSLNGDVVADSAGFTAVTAIGDGRKLDRANGIISVPGSASHPAEIAAQALGFMARINNDRAAQHYVGITMINIDPGDKADRWTSDYDSRDSAVKSGVSTTKIANGVVTMQNMVTFYHPDSIPSSSNGYRSMRNISILQNIMFNIRRNFEQEKWQGISIVADLAKVSNIVDRQKTRDVDAVIDDLTTLAGAFAGKAWLYTDTFTIDKLREDGAVQIRPGGNGFDSIFSVILSGEGGIIDTVTEFDTSIAVLTN